MYLNVCTYVCKYMFVYVCMYICECLYVYVCVYVCVYVNMCVFQIPNEVFFTSETRETTFRIYVIPQPATRGQQVSTVE